MTYTFECGVCHAVYRLDEGQISAGGVKVTCPRCLNYFFLRPGSVATEAPVIEHIVADGEQEVVVPPPSPGEPTTDQLLSDQDFSSYPNAEPEQTVIMPEIPPATPLPPPPVIPTPPSRDKVRVTRGGHPTSSDTQITKADLNDYPSDEPPRSAIDQILIPVSLIVLVISGLLYMNYRNLIRIPGFELLQEASQQKPPVTTDLPEPKSKVPDAGVSPRHGFPQVDPNYNSWENKALQGVPEETPEPSTGSNSR